MAVRKAKCVCNNIMGSCHSSTVVAALCPFRACCACIWMPLLKYLSVSQLSTRLLFFSFFLLAVYMYLTEMFVCFERQSPCILGTASL